MLQKLYFKISSFTMIFLLPVSCNCKLYNPPKNLCTVNRRKEWSQKSDSLPDDGRREEALESGGGDVLCGRQRTVGHSNQECKETSTLKCVSHIEKLLLRFLHTKK